jgi:hypothetical protein
MTILGNWAVNHGLRTGLLSATDDGATGHSCPARAAAVAVPTVDPAAGGRLNAAVTLESREGWSM